MTEKKKQTFECSAVINGCEIELTNYCGLDCIGCIRRECSDFGFLTFDTLKSIVEFIKDKGYSEIVLSGLGDVFLHKDLYLFIDYIFEKMPTIKIYIMTKGQSVINNDIDKLLEYKNKNHNLGLTFSIFSLNIELYHSVTGGGDLYSLLSLIKYSHKKGINFSFEFLVNKDNIKDIDKFRKFSRIFGKEFNYSVPHNWGGLLDKDIYGKVFNFDILKKIIRKRNKGEECEAFVGKYLFFDYNGNVYKCGFKRIKKELFLGNILGVSMRDGISCKEKYRKECYNCSFFQYRTNIQSNI